MNRYAIILGMENNNEEQVKPDVEVEAENLPEDPAEANVCDSCQ